MIHSLEPQETDRASTFDHLRVTAFRLTIVSAVWVAVAPCRIDSILTVVFLNWGVLSPSNRDLSSGHNRPHSTALQSNNSPTWQNGGVKKQQWWSKWTIIWFKNYIADAQKNNTGVQAKQPSAVGNTRVPIITAENISRVFNFPEINANTFVDSKVALTGVQHSCTRMEKEDDLSDITDV